MKWKISILAIAALLLFTGVVVAAEKQAGNYQNQEEKTQYQPLPGGNGLMQQIGNCYNIGEKTQYQTVSAICSGCAKADVPSQN